MTAKYILRSKDRYKPVETYIDINCISMDVEHSIVFDDYNSLVIPQSNRFDANPLLYSFNEIIEFVRGILRNESEDYIREHYNLVIDLNLQPIEII